MVKHAAKNFHKAVSTFGIMMMLGVGLVANVQAYEKQPVQIDPGGTFKDGSQLGGITTDDQGRMGNQSLGGGLTFLRGGPVDVASQIINWLLGVLGVFSLFLMVYAGWTWMLARGNQDKIQKAKDTLAGTAVGLLLILGAYAFLQAIFRGVMDVTETATF